MANFFASETILFPVTRREPAGVAEWAAGVFSMDTPSRIVRSSRGIIPALPSPRFPVPEFHSSPKRKKSLPCSSGSGLISRSKDQSREAGASKWEAVMVYEKNHLYLCLSARFSCELPRWRQAWTQGLPSLNELEKI